MILYSSSSSSSSSFSSSSSPSTTLQSPISPKARDEGRMSSDGGRDQQGVLQTLASEELGDAISGGGGNSYFGLANKDAFRTVCPNSLSHSRFCTCQCCAKCCTCPTASQSYAPRSTTPSCILPICLPPGEDRLGRRCCPAVPPVPIDFCARGGSGDGGGGERGRAMGEGGDGEEVVVDKVVEEVQKLVQEASKVHPAQQVPSFWFRV